MDIIKLYNKLPTKSAKKLAKEQFLIEFVLNRAAIVPDRVLGTIVIEEGKVLWDRIQKAVETSKN